MEATDKPEVVVITGASAGIGRATAHAFAKRGAHIALLARGEDGLEGARQEVESLGGKALVIPTDVSNPDEVEAAAAKVEKELGPIDIWVNDAMLSVFAPFKEITPEEFKTVTETTYLGYVYCTMTALKRMLPRDKGTIVQVGSALAYRSIPLQAAYCGGKAGIKGFTDSVRVELMHDKSKVHITMVQMPAVNTPQFGWVLSRLPNKPQPVPPIYQPEVAAEAVFWAAHHRKRELWVGFSTVKAIVGGAMVAPWYADWVLAKSGYKSQQTAQPKSPDRQDNLNQPVDDQQDRGTHGTFDNRASSESLELWVATHEGWVGGAVAAGVGLITAVAALAGRKSGNNKQAA